ncbi:MAG: M60 family metallopeptidase [Opitutales bacterium]|nr:M60 family metallopeptidase [Opitutales bacterium]
MIFSKIPLIVGALGILAFGTITSFAAPKSSKGESEIPLEEVLSHPVFAPMNNDKIPAAKDKIIGQWTWADCPKEEVDLPTTEKPWKDKGKILSLISKIDEYLQGDPKKTKAFPAAEIFPGVPTGECDLLARTVELDPTIGGWHSVGLYAPPGQKIKLSPVGKNRWPVTLRIGCHTDFLTMNHIEKNHNGELKRAPKMTNTIRLEAGKKSVELANPFGGLIYIDVPIQEGKLAKPQKFLIEGGIMSPLYIMGPKDKKGVEIAITSREEWQRQLQETHAPWGEIATPRLIFTLPNKYLQMMKIPRRVCKNLQNGMAMCDWLIGWDVYHPRQIYTPMRFVIDVQISVGWGHSGYPAMGYMAWGNCIQNGSLVKEGSWGLFHELGHNHQWAPFRFEGCGEVTVNLFSIIAQTHGVGVPYERAWDGTDVSGRSMYAPVNEFIKSKKTFDEEEDARLKLYFFVELMRSLGYESFRNVALRHHKEKPKLSTNQECWDYFFLTLCDVTDKNLTPYFELWKIDISQKAKQKAKRYREEWLPCPSYPAKMPAYKEENAAIAARIQTADDVQKSKRDKAAAEKAEQEKKERRRKMLEAI